MKYRLNKRFCVFEQGKQGGGRSLKDSLPFQNQAFGAALRTPRGSQLLASPRCSPEMRPLSPAGASEEQEGPPLAVRWPWARHPSVTAPESCGALPAAAFGEAGRWHQLGSKLQAWCASDRNGAKLVKPFLFPLTFKARRSVKTALELATHYAKREIFNC